MNYNTYDAIQNSHRRTAWLTLGVTAAIVAGVYGIPLVFRSARPAPLLNPIAFVIFALISAPAWFAGAWVRKNRIEHLLKCGERQWASVIEVVPAGLRAGITDRAVIVTVMYKDGRTGTPCTGTFWLEGELGQNIHRLKQTAEDLQLNIVYDPAKPSRFWPLLDETISQHRPGR